MSGDALQTEYEFTLPQGYASDGGTLHREGVMRLATAADEIKPLRDPRVKSNPSYLTIILLSRVITELGTLETVTPHVVENLYVSDLAYLQELYKRVNERGANVIDAVCPDCGESFAVEVESEFTGGPAKRAGAGGGGGSGPRVEGAVGTSVDEAAWHGVEEGSGSEGNAESPGPTEDP